VITLASDFETPYPAAMKGVMLQRTDARLVDVGHDFPRHDVRTAAFWLREVLPYFPSAVHLAVVDPGVGTERAALAIRPVAQAYAERPAGDRLVTVGSHGNVELAVNRGRGDDAFGVSVGDEVRVE